ncbi:DUF6387 family protein [Burkholderia aenigmatica]|uniref:DUF6387 family protein n=1 Tax=Burkholderia aenigmatica TaxID=2015348 RepID=UPI001F432BE3|nr:DUF6387 family protein [Burkholderia aenigmatica]UKD10243.1 DUF6387 family protein [Burkholderia aenigmatica]
MKKQTISEIPYWFDIKKYAVAADFDIFDWFYSINIRLTLKPGVDKREVEKFHERMEKSGLRAQPDDGVYLSMFERLMEYPAKKIPPDRKRTHDSKAAKGVVIDLSVMQVMSMAEEFQKDEKYVAAWEAFNLGMTTSHEWIQDRLKGKDEALQDSVSDYMNDKFPAVGNFVFAEIDIHAPLDDLVESFREWVQNIKSARSIPFHEKPHFSELDFKRWHKYAVLPYFDLKLWAAAKDVHIPDHLYVKALFGDLQGDIDSMFRKKTKPMEKMVMTQGCLDQLRNQGNINY